MTDLARRPDEYIRQHPSGEPPQSFETGDRTTSATSGHVDRVGHRRSTLFAIILSITIIGAATWFSNAQSVKDIAASGAVGVRAEAALSAAAVSRNRLAQTILLEQAVEIGVASSTELESSIESAAAASRELTVRTALLQADSDAAGAPIERPTAELVAALDKALAAVSARDGDTATSLMSDVDELFRVVAIQLAELRDDSMNEMIVARETAGQVAVGSRLVVAFLIPLAAVFLYRWTAVRTARRRELEHALERERATLVAKDELVANISHELRTPLTGILGFAQTAALDDELSIEDMRFMVGMIASEADELSRMIDDLITTSRDDESEVPLVVEPMDPNDELTSVLIPASIAGREIQVDLEQAYLMADRLRFRQIVRNLVSNALKYGGPNVQILGHVDGDRYLLEVVDDGDGVGEAIEERLFTRFLHQGDAPLVTGSVGLGTSIAYRLAVLMDGSIEYSRRGEHTYFTVSFPLVPATVDTH